MAARKPGYADAMRELENIVAEIESETIDVDELAEKVKRASFLIGLCKGRLRETEAEVRKVLSGMSDKKEPAQEGRLAEADPDDQDDDEDAGDAHADDGKNSGGLF